ncbi:hypothetical protein [Micromonospora wenchangensis]|uniref:hypothetical protein n=1 Tax=Micromonospora wenchangensis TaxID=1185415 RepID=UPI00344779DB
MSEHTGEEQRDVERAGKRFTPSRNSSVEKRATIANIGLVGVPLAYMTSQSVVITLIAVALAIAAVIAYVVLRRR